MTAPGNATEHHPDRTMVHVWTYPLPPARLFPFFSDPGLLAQWWGPEGWRSEFQVFDLRAGGAWRLTMVAPDGTRIPMAKRFAVVDPPRRLVVEHEQQGHSFVLDMRYEPVPEGTRLTWTTTFATAQQLEAVRGPFTQGNAQNLERLARLVGHARANG